MTPSQDSPWQVTGSQEDCRRLAADIHLLRATIDQQAGWLREITTERDALKLEKSEHGQCVEDLHGQLWAAWRERDALKLRVQELEHLLGDAYKLLQAESR